MLKILSRMSQYTPFSWVEFGILLLLVKYLTESKRATMAPDSGGIPDQKEDDYGWSKSETGNKVA